MGHSLPLPADHYAPTGSGAGEPALEMLPKPNAAPATPCFLIQYPSKINPRPIRALGIILMLRVPQASAFDANQEFKV